MERTILAANIAALRSHLGLKQTAFAELVGADQSYVSKWEAKNIEPSARPLAKMAELAGCTIDQFIDEPWSAAEAPKVAPIHKAPDIPVVRSADAGEAVEIIQLDLSLPMGPGATVDDYIEEEPRLFDLSYIRSFTRTPPHRLRLARGVGDSMFPTLLSNDLVWIDSTQTQLNQSDRIWAVSINGGAAIKRLRPLDGGRRVLVMSDNPGPGHDSYDVDRSEILIGGRVIRFARDL